MRDNGRMNRLQTGPSRPDDRPLADAGWLLAAQALVALAVLALSLAPARGGTAVLLPVPYASNDARSIDWARTRGATVLGPGPYIGSIVVRLPQDAPPGGALLRGMLLLAIPEAWCGQTPALIEIAGPHS